MLNQFEWGTLVGKGTIELLKWALYILFSLLNRFRPVVQPPRVFSFEDSARYSIHVNPHQMHDEKILELQHPIQNRFLKKWIRTVSRRVRTAGPTLYLHLWAHMKQNQKQCQDHWVDQFRHLQQLCPFHILVDPKWMHHRLQVSLEGHDQ